ncbi:MAG: 50S ribosomal protein L24e [Candidatus Micrarchaeota archaeon]|nr:50S ribosomal protein L24e [Candidatus Micrarchaeota archaeon]
MKCNYCQKEIRKGTGTMFVYTTGAISYFCSNRCYKTTIFTKRKINPKLTRTAKK